MNVYTNYNGNMAMLKSHNVTEEVVKKIHTLEWDNGVSAKVETVDDTVTSFNFFCNELSLNALNIKNIEEFFNNFREETKNKICLTSLEDVKSFNCFDKLFGIKSNMLFDMSGKVLCTYMDVTVHATLRSKDLERFLKSNDQIKSLFVVSECNELYNYKDDSDARNENVYVNSIKLKFASDEAMIKVIGSNDVRMLKFIDRSKISNIIMDELKIGN